jgi:hypothetical protein|tara:strand:- start:4635 stop:4799 length:165 start_codon:yes stop_codon:yes gene_type:complete
MAKKQMNPTEKSMLDMRLRRQKDSRYQPGPSKINRYNRWLRRVNAGKYKQTGKE